MSTATPPPPHPIDPVSERLGALGADMAAVKDRLDKIERRLEQLPGKWELRILLALVVAVLAAVRALG
jgi:hypothetical protein